MSSNSIPYIGIEEVTKDKMATIKALSAELLGTFMLVGIQARINTTEKTLLEKIDSRTMLLKSCIMSSYFKSTILDCSVTSILYSYTLYVFKPL